MLHNEQWMKSLWNLSVEEQQASEEGKDLSSVRLELNALMQDNQNPDLYDRAERLYQAIQALPSKPGYPYAEPGSLDDIHQEAKSEPSLPNYDKDDQALLDQILGAWQGRLSGCLLGQPVEGWHRDRILGFLKETHNYPIQRYLSSDVAPDIRERYRIVDGPGGYDREKITWINNINGVQEDDDINYTVLALKLVSSYGRDFTTEHVAAEWLNSLPLLRTCTAERVAYLNLARLIGPPETASYANPFREWIGAQIRADFYGYINPGNPRKAAEMAYRDASLSHVKNGVYGAMFVAAMIAAAFVTQNPETIVSAGMAQIPARSRLYKALEELLTNWRAGFSLDAFQLAFYEKYDERNPHHWCHTIPNAVLVAAGVLYHRMDFAASVGFGVTSGFDTDCNAATIGSIVGAALGSSGLDPAWINPLGARVRTCVPGYDYMEISELSKRTLALASPGIELNEAR